MKVGMTTLIWIMEKKGVNGDLDMDDGDDNENHYGAEGNEGDEPSNDDEGHDDEVCENIGNEDNVGVFDWNDTDAEIDERN